MALFRCTGRSKGRVKIYSPCWTIRDLPLQCVGGDFNVSDVLVVQCCYL